MPKDRKKLKDPKDAELDAYRSDPSGQELTTNQGVPVADNQNTLRAGTRGPIAARRLHLAREDHALRSRAHPRARRARARCGGARLLPSLRVDGAVHAAAFLRTRPRNARVRALLDGRRIARLGRHTRATFAALPSSSTRSEGNYDLVGNNMPVFFIQDAIKFPDFVHAVKPEPHNEIPQASSAHDTFWDFVSLDARSTPHGDVADVGPRAPARLRMMEGFGVHTFRFLNAAGESRFVKFHWKPLPGAHSLVWDEAQKLVGNDPDFNRRDLFESIEKGDFPEWELGRADFRRRGSRPFRLRHPRSDQAHSRRARSGSAHRQDGARSATPTTTSRRPSKSRSAPRTRAGNRLHQRPAAAGPHLLVSRHAALAPGRPELSRDSDQPAGLPVQQRAARRVAPA